MNQVINDDRPSGLCPGDFTAQTPSLLLTKASGFLTLFWILQSSFLKPPLSLLILAHTCTKKTLPQQNDRYMDVSLTAAIKKIIAKEERGGRDKERVQKVSLRVLNY
jgi:hypothetical protein